MKFFIDTADINEIRDLNELGLIDGVTTNPSLIYKSGKDFKKVIKEISLLVKGPISAEVTSTKYAEMLRQANDLTEIADNIVIKVPLTMDGLKACNSLSTKNIKVNVTLCFSTSQAILAAKMGATYISPFIGRLDDISHNGMSLIKDIVKIYKNYSSTISTKVLVASVRSPSQVKKAAKLGADIATIPPSIIYQMMKHPLTDKGLNSFMEDWKKTGQNF